MLYVIAGLLIFLIVSAVDSAVTTSEAWRDIALSLHEMTNRLIRIPGPNPESRNLKG